MRFAAKRRAFARDSSGQRGPARRGHNDPVSTRVEAVFWPLALVALAVFGVCAVGNDLVSSALLIAACGAGALGFLELTRPFAMWLAGGVAAVSGAIITLVFEASMNGAKEDPPSTPLLFALLVAAVVSARLHNHAGRVQEERDRELDRRLAALPTTEQLREVEQRLMAISSSSEYPRASSWIAWWRGRPCKGWARSGGVTQVRRTTHRPRGRPATPTLARAQWPQLCGRSPAIRSLAA